jgi:hypothetical protein
MCCIGGKGEREGEQSSVGGQSRPKPIQLTNPGEKNERIGDMIANQQRPSRVHRSLTPAVKRQPQRLKPGDMLECCMLVERCILVSGRIRSRATVGPDGHRRLLLHAFERGAQEGRYVRKGSRLSCVSFLLEVGAIRTKPVLPVCQQ